MDNIYPFTWSKWVESIQGGGMRSRVRAQIITKKPYGTYLASMS
jgi:hypothetical protein